MRQTLSEFEEHDEGFGLMGEERRDEFVRPDRRLPALLLAAAAMAVFAGGIWFAYVEGTHHPVATGAGTGVPLIRADNEPTKVKPDQPGGMKIPDQNVSIYSEKPGGPPVEKLLPAPEQPMPRPAPPPPPPLAPILAPSLPPAAVQERATPAPAAARPSAKAMARARIAAAAEHAGRSGPIRIRLGSVRSAEAARNEWVRLKRSNPDLLGKLNAVAIRTDLGDKGTYYRVEAGPFADAAAAERLCGELKRRKLGCILAR